MVVSILIFRWDLEAAAIMLMLVTSMLLMLVWQVTLGSWLGGLG